LRDNVALALACERSQTVALAFVVDTGLLANGRMSPAIVQCFFSALEALRSELRERGSDLAILIGAPERELPRFAHAIDAACVYYNEDYDPTAVERDRAVAAALDDVGVEMRASLDHVYFGAREVLTNDGKPYKVFTPFRTRWLTAFGDCPRGIAGSLRATNGKLLPAAEVGMTAGVPVPEDFGFTRSARYPRCSERVAHELLKSFVRERADEYGEARDYPAKDGTSHLSPQLRAGTIGIRTCIEGAKAAPAWLNELIWREFYQAIVAWFPSVTEGPFLPQGRRLRWRQADDDFEAWCEGRTGYPIVDAPMRQLNETGWMHNRLRMIVASFLTKDLLIDWRRGERYFERRLADADLAQNNGGWQWAASTGTDSVPYFRIFNPVTQGERFDPEGQFVKTWLPELRDLPPKIVHKPRDPIVDHAVARKRALAEYERAFRG
jgi:deoxyribodipyrimidine photo-lyase